MDLDRFKAVNDTLGHEAGDTVLKGVAERLEKTVRKVDTVARIGGDEFIIVLTVIKQKSDAAIVAQNAIDSLSKPFDIGQNSISIGASVGIAIYPDDGTVSDELLRCADEAMYAIKQSGKNSFGFASS